MPDPFPRSANDPHSSPPREHAEACALPLTLAPNAAALVALEGPASGRCPAGMPAAREVPAPVVCETRPVDAANASGAAGPEAGSVRGPGLPVSAPAAHVALHDRLTGFARGVRSALVGPLASPIFTTGRMRC